MIFAVQIFASSGTNAFVVSIAGDRLSIDANQIPLQDILTRLVEQGLTVRIDRSINPRITASFRDRELREGLSSIIKPLDHAFVWKTVKGPIKSFVRIEEIHVFLPGKMGLIRQLQSESGRVVVRNPEDGSLYLKDEILFRLRPGLTLSDFNRILRKVKGTVVEGNDLSGIYKIRLVENSDIPSLIKGMADYPGIADAEPNYAYPVSPDFRYIRKTGSGTAFSISSDIPLKETSAPVAVIDTGLARGSGIEEYVIASLDVLNPEEPVSDSLGHGTQMALIAAGVVKPYGLKKNLDGRNSIIPIKAFDDGGYVSSFDMMSSLDFAIQKGARVLNLSWGSEIRSDFLEQDLNYAASRGLIIVASAGNEPTGIPVYPAAFRSVIGVGALGPDGNPWERSNFGDFVMVQAPGFASLPVGYKGDPGIYAGTSIASAFTSYLISDYLSENPNATTKEILNALEKY